MDFSNDSRDTRDTLDWDDAEEITRPGGDDISPKGARVLVVDEDWAIRALYSAHLSREGFDVYGVASARELLEVLENIAANRAPLDGVDLVLLDVRTPKMSALDAVRALRLAGWASKALLLTDDPDLDFLIEAVRLDAEVILKANEQADMGAITREITLVLIAANSRRSTAPQMQRAFAEHAAR
jgi:DNA-binding response OmpR family regulator